jgi:hypothetical protein
LVAVVTSGHICRILVVAAAAAPGENGIFSYQFAGHALLVAKAAGMVGGQATELHCQYSEPNEFDTSMRGYFGGLCLVSKIVEHQAPLLSIQGVPSTALGIQSQPSKLLRLLALDRKSVV